MNTHYLSKPEIIAIAACPTCCAMRGEQCTFSREDDPHLHRTVAKQSHLTRMQQARKIIAEEKDTNPLDSIELIL